MPPIPDRTAGMEYGPGDGGAGDTAANLALLNEQMNQLKDPLQELTKRYQTQQQQIQKDIEQLKKMQQAAKDANKPFGDLAKLLKNAQKAAEEEASKTAAAKTNMDLLVQSLTNLSTVERDAAQQELFKRTATLAGTLGLKALGAEAGQVAKLAYQAGAAFGAVGAAIGALVLAPLALLGYGAFKFAQGTVRTQQVLYGALRATTANFQDVSQMFLTMNAAAIPFGITQKEYLGALAHMQSTYAFSQRSLGDASAQNLSIIGRQIVMSIALGKAMGLSSEASQELASNLVLMGSNIKNLPQDFERFQQSAVASGLTVADLSKILGMMAPVSSMVSTAGKGMTDSMIRFRTIFEKSTDSYTFRLGTVAQQQRRFAETMMEFSKATSSMSIAQRLVGAGLEPGHKGGFAEALVAAARVPPEQRMTGLLQRVMGAARPGEELGTGIAFLNTQFGMSLESSLTMAELVRDLNRYQRTNQRDQARQTLGKLEDLARTSGVLEDPLQKLVKLVEQILMLLGRFFGGVGNLLPNVLRNLIRTGEAVQQAAQG